MYNPRHRKARVLYGLADILILLVAFAAAYQTRLRLPVGHNFAIALSAQALIMGFAATVQVFLGLTQEVYESLEAASPLEATRRTLKQTIATFAGLVLFEYLLRLDLSRPFLALYFVYAMALMVAFRANAGGIAQWIRRDYGAPLDVLIVGVANQTAAVAAEVRRQAENVRVHELTPREAIAEVPARLSREVIDEIIFAVSSEELAQLEDLFLLCDSEGVRTRVALDFFPHVNSTVYLDQFGASRMLTFSAAPHDEIRLLVKRFADIVISLAALLLLWPFLLFIALLVRLTSKGPAIYRQTRCGLNGRTFTFYKFRTMIHNADAMKAELAHLNVKKTAFKIPNDPRLTPIGRWLRKFSIDEFPQFWNVLRGDMSLVGPRPPVPEEVKEYERWQRRRLRMRPGLTCLWALAGRDELEFDDWMKLDMEYIDTWSLILDTKIILRTIPSVLSGKGAN